MNKIPNLFQTLSLGSSKTEHVTSHCRLHHPLPHVPPPLFFVTPSGDTILQAGSTISVNWVEEGRRHVGAGEPSKQERHFRKMSSLICTSAGHIRTTYVDLYCLPRKVCGVVVFEQSCGNTWNQQFYLNFKVTNLLFCIFMCDSTGTIGLCEDRIFQRYIVLTNFSILFEFQCQSFMQLNHI